MDNIAGSPVEGSNFFGRRADVARIQEALENHDVLLLGPRRIGKTSVSRAIMQALRDGGSHAIEINVASCTDERGFLDKLESALRKEFDSCSGKWWESVIATFGALSQRIKALKVSIPGAGTVGLDLSDGPSEEWVAVGNDFLTLIGQLERRCLIYVNELPIFLYNILRNDQQAGVSRVRRFLDWFRNDVRGLPGAGQVRWLVSGSVGLDTLVQQHGMADTINSLKHVGLPPFSEDEARAMLLSLADRYQLAFGAAETSALLAAIQWLQPYYIQLAFSELRSLMAARPTNKPADLIDAALECMTQPGQDNDFHFWEQRLSLQLPKADAGHAIAMLTQAAATREGARPDTLLATLHGRVPDATEDEARKTFIRLRDILQRDAYWLPDSEGPTRRYRFMLEPLRRWWLRRNSL